jgi:hypothetical protein
MDMATVAEIANPTMTPTTDAVKFTVTPKDVGSQAVRAGHMAELEERCHTLIVAAKLVLQRSENGKARLDAVSEHALSLALQIAQAPL